MAVCSPSPAVHVCFGGECEDLRPHDQAFGCGVLQHYDVQASMFAKPEATHAAGRAGYDIQFTPASLFHFVVIFFDFVQNSIEPRPVMSPTPNFESFQPPKLNGSRGTGTPTFTPTIPALAFSIT